VAKLYVEDKREVRDRIARTGQRLSAVELTSTKLRQSPRSRLMRTLTDHHRFTRFIKARAEAIADYWRGREKGISRA
jgi:hypothetical protein